MDRTKHLAERDLALASAHAAMSTAAPRVAADPRRPAYHFLPPAHWMNDPNGTVYHDGWHHLFYQQHPYSDRWDAMHWGHARSRDLVHWEHLPIALWPSKSLGEDHCFSGCAVVDDAGRPMAFYTSISGGRGPEQWLAVGDKDLIAWEKHAASPVLTLASHGSLAIDDWRDPCVFREAGTWYMVVGGHVHGETGCVFLYRSLDLVRWEFDGIPFRGTQGNWECPNLFRLGDKWVLIVSPHNSPYYWVGDLDLAACRFTPVAEGSVDVGNFYAPTTLLDGQGRRIMIGWINGCPLLPEGAPSPGWAGCMSLPRVLSLDATNHLVQTPVPELVSLRGEKQSLAPRTLAAGAMVRLDGLAGQLVELEIDIELSAPDAAAGLRLLAHSDGSAGLDLTFRAGSLELAGKTTPAYDPAPRLRRTLRVFIDHSVVEVYAEGFPCITRIAPDVTADDRSLFLRADGQARVHRLDAWALRPA
ncbi:MAG: glycoside hydrolase family 32 protein [Planctomycetota bacterium]|nr:glycoside hydrolase family 32 protein [Planctomycetota bacterium]